ncbi:MAG: multidrug efflux RND transporter permease subunit [Veillonellales bacterium]
MSKFFIERPIFAIVIAIIITMIGVIAAINLPVAQYPHITPPQASVSATYTGANAQVVEETIAQLIELQVNGVENMISMISTSSDNGKYSLNVKFNVGTDGDIDTVQTQNRVAAANAGLPNEVKQSGVTTRKVSSDLAMVFNMYSPNGTYDQTFLKNYGSINVIEDLKRVKGVGDVGEYGADFSMRIWLKPDKMAQLGVTTTEVSNAIGDQNVQAPAGIIGQQPSPADQQFQYTARVQGRLVQPDEFKKIIIRANSDGSFIRLGDIAEVDLGGRGYSYYATIDEQPSAGFAIQLLTDANVLETVGECKRVLAEASKKFPADMKYKITVDTTDFVTESMKEVVITFFEALLLVVLVVFLFLQSGRATLIPLLAVPVSLLGTFGAFMILGFSINTLTLFAMVLAIGLVVDDAIVVIEAVEHHMRYSGMSPHDATVRAMEEVSGPVVAIAFVLAAVFIPVAFYGGTVGVLYKQFALTIAVSMALSALVALSLTPALCALLLKPYNPEQHTGLLAKFFDKFNSWFESTVESYGRGVGRIVKRAAASLLIVGGLLILVGGLFKILPSSFVPAEDQGFSITQVSLPDAASLNRTIDVSNKVVDMIRSQPGVESAMAVNGLDLLANANKSSSATIFTKLKPWAERTTPDKKVENIVLGTMIGGSHIPEATTISFNAPALPGLSSQGGFTLMLEDRGAHTDAELDEINKKFLAAAKQRPEIGMISSSYNVSTPGYQYVVDREKAKMLGIAIDDIYQALQVFLGGLEVNDFNAFGRSYKVIIQANPEFRDKPEDIRYYYVKTSSGTMVPLNTVVKQQATVGPTAIKRFNGYRAIQLNGNQATGYSSGQTMTALEEIAAQTLPNNITYEWSDQSREEKISGGRAPMLFALALCFVFLCLAALYESWSIPLVVLLSVPTGLFGAFLFQYIRHLENNLYMQIGLIMLIGLAAKNAILIVEFAKVRVDKGMNPVDAAIEAAKLRLRPILMTSLAFIIGCIPLAVATGAGAGARNSMGTAVVGGMLMATSIGIFLIPMLFVFIEKHFTEKLQNRRQEKRLKDSTTVEP